MGDGVLEIEGLSNEEVGTVAARENVTLFELSVQGASLEDAYLALTRDSVDHRSGAHTSGEPGSEGEAA